MGLNVRPKYQAIASAFEHSAQSRACSNREQGYPSRSFTREFRQGYGKWLKQPIWNILSEFSVQGFSSIFEMCFHLILNRGKSHQKPSSSLRYSSNFGKSSKLFASIAKRRARIFAFKLDTSCIHCASVRKCP